MTAALLQPPIFDPTADLASNYGGAGFAIAHEIIHSVPQPNGVGNAVLKGLKRWGSADSAAFVRRAQPLAEQLNRAGRGAVGYTVGEMKEVLPDLGGLLIAYDAFERAMQGRPRQLIDGLTPEQRFFVAYADLFRTNRWHGQPNFYDIPAPKPFWESSHAPGRLRVNAIVANVPAFAKAFGCKAGDPMALPDAERVVVY